MPYDKDLRELISATKKVSRSVPQGVERERAKLRNKRIETPDELTAFQPDKEMEQAT